MMISMIAAVARNRAIGYQNKLIYWLPNDLKRFKQLTTGHTIIMGRNTYHSLPKGALPNRRNVVLSTTLHELPGCDVFPTLQAALDSCQPDEDVYIIGGASVYEQGIHLADRLCLTEVDDTPEQADTFFPDYSDWQIANKEAHPKDERHDYDYAFVDYVRKWQSLAPCSFSDQGQCGVAMPLAPNKDKTYFSFFFEAE